LETEREFIGPIWTKTLASRIYSSANLQVKVRIRFGVGWKSGLRCRDLSVDFGRERLTVMSWDGERVYSLVGFALYPVWGLVSSALLLTRTSIPSHGLLLSTGVCIVVAGALPVGLHIYEAQTGKAMFSWGTLFLSLKVGGIASIMFGALLPGLLILLGVHSILGLRIDQWYWRFPVVDY
jgi:hypothetical protein